VLAYFLHDFGPFIVKFGNGFGLRWYGLAYVLAFLLGYGLYRRLAERGYTDMAPGQVADFITWAAVFGVMVGGRLGWILFYGLSADHSQDPWYWPLEVWKGGMASHGGILALVLFTFYFARRHRLSWTSIGDSLVTVAPVGLFVVRCANFINGELWGRPSTVPWAVQFPTELPENPAVMHQLSARFPMILPMPDLGAAEDLVRHAQHNLLNPFASIDPELAQALKDVLPPRHPSQLYEAALEGLLLFLILWIMRTRMRLPRGVLTGAFFVLYALLRIIGEVFRVPDPAWAVGRFSAGQFLSLFMFVIGAGFLVWGWKTQQYEPIFLPAGGGPVPESVSAPGAGKSA
jgi:phosphatidylglycerol---prolipoprotein diacylglyceryl transferase